MEFLQVLPRDLFREEVTLHLGYQKVTWKKTHDYIWVGLINPLLFDRPVLEPTHLG